MISTASSENDRSLVPSQVTWWIFALGASLRILFFFYSDNAGGDALARASLTAGWINHPALRFVFDGWLPLHFWLMGGLAILIGNVEFASRLLSLLTGVASLCLFWKIARTIYSERAANLSLLVFALYGLHVGYSTTSSSEVPYLFFVLGGLLCFLNYQKSSRRRWIVLSGFCLTMGAAIRTEAWVISFALALALVGLHWEIGRLTFWRSGLLSPLVLFCVTAGSWPIFWMSYSRMKWGNPLFFMVQNHINVMQELAGHPTSQMYRLAFFPGVLLLTLTPVGIVGALYALWLAIRERPGREIAVVLLTVGLMQTYELATAGLATRARYTLTLGTFLAIMAGHGLDRLGQRYFPGARRAFQVGVAAVLAMNLVAILALSERKGPYSEKFASISPRLRFPRYVVEVGDDLRRRLSSGDAVVIDNYNVESNIIAAAAGLPLLQGDRVFEASVEKPKDLEVGLRGFFETKHPRYLVFSSQGTLRPYLALPSGCPSDAAKIEGISFRCLFANSIYTVYEVSYPGSAAPGSATNPQAR